MSAGVTSEPPTRAEIMAWRKAERSRLADERLASDPDERRRFAAAIAAHLDRFIGAMIAIREEIRQIENGVWSADNNPLKNAPHSQADVMHADWQHPYSRQQAVFPLPWVAANKFWPSVNRIDDVYGDRNLNCACPPMSAYED